MTPSSTLGLVVGFSAESWREAHVCGFHTSGEGWGVGVSSQAGAPKSVQMQQTASGTGSRGYDSKGTKSVRSTLRVWTRPEAKRGTGWDEETETQVTKGSV